MTAESLPVHRVAQGDQIRAQVRASVVRLVAAQRAHVAAGCHELGCLGGLYNQGRVISTAPEGMTSAQHVIALLFEAVRVLAGDPGEDESVIERTTEVLTDHYDRWPATAVTDPHQGAAYALLAAGLLASDRDGG